MKKIRIISVFTALCALVSGCAAPAETAPAGTAAPETTTTTAAETTEAATAAAETTAETTAGTTAQETVTTTAEAVPAPEFTLPDISSQTPADDAGFINEFDAFELPDALPWQGKAFYPPMPEADKAAMADSALVGELTAAYHNALRLLLIMNGQDIGLNLDFGSPRDFDWLTAEYGPAGTYYPILDNIPNEASLVKLYEDAFTGDFLSRSDIMERLFAPRERVNEDTEVPYFYSDNGELLYYSTYSGVPPKLHSPSITRVIDENTVEVTAAGAGAVFESWARQTLRFVREDGLWKVDGEETALEYYMPEYFNYLLYGLWQMDMISGSVTPGEGGEITVDGKVYIDVDDLMTPEDMEYFLDSRFTADTARKYKEMYLGKFIWDDDLGLCIEKDSAGVYFGSYDAGDCTVESEDGDTVTYSVKWYGAPGNSPQVSIAVRSEDGILKIASLLPTSDVPTEDDRAVG